MRLILVFLIMFGIAAAFIFGYRYISKQDVKIAGKLTFAGIIAAILTTVIYLGEVA